MFSTTQPTNQLTLTLPTWLVAAVTPEQVCAGLRRQVAQFANGALTLLDCEVKRLRFRESQGSWSGTYLLTVTRSSAGEGATGDQGAALIFREGSADSFVDESNLPGRFTKNPGERQIVVLQGTLIAPGQPEPATSSNTQPLGAESWRCYLPELRLALRTQAPDKELAALPQLTDPEQARQLLETSLRSGGNRAKAGRHALRIQACRPKVARYKPGSRCTLLYHLEYPPQTNIEGNWPNLVVAKTYQSDKGQQVFDGMEALWQSPLGASHTVAIAEPLAYVPELNLLLQSPIREERTLKELIRQALRTPETADSPESAIHYELAGYMRKTAAGLAELHRCDVQHGETLTWEAELAEIYERRRQLATPLPHLATLAEDLLAQLQQVAAQTLADPAAPAHSSFRPAQVLLHQGEIGFIDFDGFCQAEPAMDLALFMTTVRNLALNKASREGDEEEEDGESLDAATRLARLERAEALCQLFLAEYERHAPVARTRIFLWETLDLLSLLLGSWTKLKLARLENCWFLLERHLLKNADKMAG